MEGFKLKILFFVLFIGLSQLWVCFAQHALFVDTSGKTFYDYRNFLALSKSVGFEVKYQNFYSFISDLNRYDQKINNLQAQKYKTIFLIMDFEFINNSNNALIQKCFKYIENYVLSGNKNIALFFPPSISLEKAVKFLKSIGVVVEPEIVPIFESFVRTSLQKEVNKGILFDTTLINKGQTDKFEHEHYVSLINKETENLFPVTLPVAGRTFDPIVVKTLPLAIFFKDKKLNNTYFIANYADYTFCEIVENFFSNPISFDLRQERLRASQAVLQDFYTIITKHNFVFTKKQSSLNLPKKLTERFNLAQKKKYENKLKKRLANSPDYKWIFDRRLLCALLDHDDYLVSEPKGTTPSAMQRGMDFLYDSGINLAWFGFSPEGALSKLVKKDSQSFIDTVKKISIEMNKRYEDGEKQPPKFFVGTNITTNYRSNSVSADTKDFFGKTYSKIPSPLDFGGFWKPEILDVFDSLIEKLGDEVKIDGIFFDFEMYHAQDQASDYTDFMDFSDISWKLYAERVKNPKLLAYVSVLDRTKYLTEKNLFVSYFDILTKEARSIGQKIKKHIRTKLPHALFAAYAPTLPSSWFYRGITAGLSSKREPLIYVTFNTDFYSHASWLEKQGIYLIHGSAVLLSKLEKKSDMNLIRDLLKYQYFVWLNRPSRMIFPVEKRKNVWWEPEASKLPANELAHEIQEQI